MNKKMVLVFVLLFAAQATLAMQPNQGQIAQPDELWEASWFDAAATGDVRIIANGLNRGLNVNMVDHDGVTALMLAAKFGQTAVIKKLLTAPTINVNFAAQGNTALDQAVIHGQEAAVAQLLTSPNIDVNLVAGSMTPLEWAAYYGRATIVTLLLRAGANPNKPSGVTSLMLAADKGHLEVIRRLVRAGANVNATFEGKTALSMAAEQGRRDVVAALTEIAAEEE